ncbi:MAG: hypothetical protein JO029_07405 [Candidatus Eremiobacteraeota bacterium]|nr:hypothetical protein [Candidatus Eremiobacteraeota bacterium]MBV8434086.1 hypothetical protein [Candidatus Eremiobacteraeota bacterium]MBV8655126.1 hypothetical protein [Candidatus Eremiobacteraeota bacterium]
MNARAFFSAASLVLAACTPNAVGSTSGGGGGGVTHTVDINLTLSQPAPSTYGQTGGFTPAIVMAKVGDTIVFKNTDSFAHTSTSIPVAETTNETQFPSKYPFNNPGEHPLSQSGNTLSGGWSSGEVQAGSTSQNVLVDKAGTYLFGCAIHYGAPMRGAIVAQ